MVNFLLSVVVWYYTARAVSYSVYTFKERNIIGGVSVIFLALLIFASSILFLIDIFK